MNEEDIRTQLSDNNPFFSGIAKEPWENTAPDVLSLHQKAYEGLCRLINAKNEQPGTPVAGLVVGETGMGKTHLLKRLLNYTRINNINTAFASIKPFEDPETPMQYLLREIVVNLAKVEKDERGSEKAKEKQFEYLVSMLMHRYHEKSNDQGFNLSQSVIPFFRGCFPEIDLHVLRALSHYRNDHDPMVRPLILSWLGGEILDEEAVKTLGFRDREGMSVAALEAEAKGIILSLGLLLEFCGMSLIICFDQLEGMRDNEVIRAFGKMVHFLVNEVPAMLPLAFARLDTWDNRFTAILDQSVQQRFNKRFVLEGCSFDQARELIRLRLASRFQDDYKDRYQWLLKRVEPRLQEGYTPRVVIELASEVIDSSTGTSEATAKVSIPKLFIDEYQQEKDRVAADFDMWLPDTGRLRRALEAWLKSRSNFKELKRGNDKYVALAGKCAEVDKQVDCAFVINTAGHHKTAEAAFKRGVDFLRQHGGRCWYITDGRCSFPDSWKIAHQAKKEFESLGGRVLILDRTRAVEWYGLTSLIFKLENRDISLPDSANVLRPAGEKDFDVFMEKGFKTDLLAVPSVPPGEPPPPVELPVKNEAALEEKTIMLLKRSPMRIEKATLLLGELTQQGESLSYEIFLEFVNKRRERFALHPSSNGSLVQLLK